MTKTENRPFRLVAFSGNPQRPSRSRALAGTIARSIQRQVPVTIDQYDVLDAGPGLGTALSREQLTPTALAIVEAIETADILVVTTPVYKGSYTGLFKHLIDFVDMNALIGRPVVIGATGGGQRHALMVEHQLRPLFGFFSALTVPTAIYADDTTFEAYEQVDPGILARIELAATQAALILQNREPQVIEQKQQPRVSGNVISISAQA
jgi:FMN reductase